MTIEERVYNTKLTKNEKLIYEFIFNNKEKACLMTSKDIAKASGVGTTSVIRLAHTLGFQNFAVFRKAFQKETLSTEKNFSTSDVPYEKKKMSDSINLSEIPSLVRQCFIKKAETDNSNNSDKKYEQIAKMIVTADKKYVAGFRNTAGIAGYFSTVLSHILTDVRKINTDGFEDEAIDMSQKDILILFSLPRYSKNAYMILNMAKEANCKVVVLTDKITSPITSNADKVIVSNIDSVSFANSISGLVLSVEILISLISNISGKVGQDRLKKLDKYMSESGMY